jgi:hypothetical protein
MILLGFLEGFLLLMGLQSLILSFLYCSFLGSLESFLLGILEGFLLLQGFIELLGILKGYLPFLGFTKGISLGFFNGFFLGFLKVFIAFAGLKRGFLLGFLEVFLLGLLLHPHPVDEVHKSLFFMVLMYCHAES